MKYTITYELNPKFEDTQGLNDGISKHTMEKKDMRPIESFAFFIRDEKRRIVGGCAGNNLYGCLYIDQLWVTELLRGQGYGTELMRRAEALAEQDHCQFMAVNTFDWEALHFYKRLGFYIEFERRGFDKDSIFYFLRKDLLNV